MELVFLTTAKFADDLRSLGPEGQHRVEMALNLAANSFLVGRVPPGGGVKQLPKPELPSGLESTLYVLRASRYRVMLTLDPDPLFSEMRVTLLRVVRRDRMDQTYGELVKSLYHDLPRR